VTKSSTFGPVASPIEWFGGLPADSWRPGPSLDVRDLDAFPTVGPGPNQSGHKPLPDRELFAEKCYFFPCPQLVTDVNWIQVNVT